MLQFDIALEAHELEALAHRLGHGQLACFVAQAQSRDFVLRLLLGFGQALVQPVAEQEHRLRGVAGQVETGIGAGLGVLIGAYLMRILHKLPKDDPIRSQHKDNDSEHAT